MFPSLKNSCGSFIVLTRKSRIRSWQPHIPTWWRHQMETFSALLPICAGNSPVPGEFPTQRPVTRSFDVYFDLRPNKWLSKQPWGWWFETLSCSLWRHRNVDETFLWVSFRCSNRPVAISPYHGGRCNTDTPSEVLNSNFAISLSSINSITVFWSRRNFAKTRAVTWILCVQVSKMIGKRQIWI